MGRGGDGEMGGWGDKETRRQGEICYLIIQTDGLFIIFTKLPRMWL